MPHIPQGTTDTVALELFEPALDAALRPSPDYDVSRWLYVPNTYSEYRYILGSTPPPPRRTRWTPPCSPPSASP